MLRDVPWGTAISLTDEERHDVRARTLRAAGVEWAEAALRPDEWSIEHTPNGRPSGIHRPDCPGTRSRGERTLRRCSVLELAPLVALCGGCIAPEVRSWWVQSHQLYKLYEPLQLADELLAGDADWALLVRAVAGADRLLQAHAYPEDGPVDEALLAHCVRKGEAVLEEAALLATAPGFTARAREGIRLAGRFEGGRPRAAVEAAFTAPGAPAPVGETTAVVAMANVIGDPLAVLLSLARPVLARTGTRRLVLATPEEAITVAGAGALTVPGRSWEQVEGIEDWDQRTSETALALWEPWEEGTLAEIGNAHSAAVGVLAG